MTSPVANAHRIAEIERRLTELLRPEVIRIKDQSHLHAGHAGAAAGMGHFAVYVVSPAFAGLPRVQRHRVIYDALGDLMKTDIHALKIEALTPGETHKSLAE